MATRSYDVAVNGVSAPRSFSEFNATPATGPTYTDLARENERLRGQVATLIAGQQRNGEARQQARLDMAHELAEMEPDAREKAIRRIIDNAQ
jgi:hypothetical protein